MGAGPRCCHICRATLLRALHLRGLRAEPSASFSASLLSPARLRPEDRGRGRRRGPEAKGVRRQGPGHQTFPPFPSATTSSAPTGARTPCRPRHLLCPLPAGHSACWMHSLEGSDYYMRSLQGAVSTGYTPCRGKRLLNASVEEAAPAVCTPCAQRALWTGARGVRRRGGQETVHLVAPLSQA